MLWRRTKDYICFLVLTLLCGAFITSRTQLFVGQLGDRGTTLGVNEEASSLRPIWLLNEDVQFIEIWDVSACCKYVQMAGIVDVLCATPSLTRDKCGICSYVMQSISNTKWLVLNQLIEKRVTFSVYKTHFSKNLLCQSVGFFAGIFGN